MTCGRLRPTPAGQAKVERNVAMAIRFFLRQINWPNFATAVTTPTC